MTSPLNVPDVTPLILTYNEEENIGRALDALAWAQRVVVLDSGSTDRTLDIVARYDTAEVVHRPFDDHATQWNFGLSRPTTEWVLALDADYLVTDDFVNEMVDAVRRSEVDGFVVPFTYCIGGRPLRRSLYPPHVALFRRTRARYVRDGHTQRLQLDGPAGVMQSHIFHDDRKPLRRWLEAQDRYARLEAEKLARADAKRLSMADRARRAKILAPALAFIHCLVVKGLILDGPDGIYYALQRLYAETLLSLYLADADGNA